MLHFSALHSRTLGTRLPQRAGKSESSMCWRHGPSRVSRREAGGPQQEGQELLHEERKALNPMGKCQLPPFFQKENQGYQYGHLTVPATLAL